MKNKVLRLILLLCLLCLLTVLCLGTASAETAAETTQEGYTYTVTDGQATITGYTGTSKTLNIPATVNEYPVIAIGSKAFFERKDLTGGLMIPDNVASIGTQAFFNCSSLTGSLTIPESVTKIETQAFYKCSGLTGNLTIPDSITKINNGIFWECSGLTGSLTIPRSVTAIDVDAFCNCNFTKAYVSPKAYSLDSRAFKGCSPIIYGYAGTPLSAYEKFIPCDITLSGGDYVYAGETLQLSAEFTTPPGEPGKGFIFSSSDDKIASVDQTGLVTGLSPGTAIITAASRHFRYDLPVEVIENPEMDVISSEERPSEERSSTESEVLWTNVNLYDVQNKAQSQYVMLDIETECVVTSIMTYHYFNMGALPGTIMLYAQSGEQWGPFQAEGVEGQGGVENACWVAEVGEIRLLPGRYAIEDSDPGTWSSNDLSGNDGFAELRGYTISKNPFDVTMQDVPKNPFDVIMQDVPEVMVTATPAIVSDSLDTRETITDLTLEDIRGEWTGTGYVDSIQGFDQIPNVSQAEKEEILSIIGEEFPMNATFEEETLSLFAIMDGEEEELAYRASVNLKRGIFTASIIEDEIEINISGEIFMEGSLLMLRGIIVSQLGLLEAELEDIDIIVTINMRMNLVKDDQS